MRKKRGGGWVGGGGGGVMMVCWLICAGGEFLLDKGGMHKGIVIGTINLLLLVPLEAI